MDQPEVDTCPTHEPSAAVMGAPGSCSRPARDGLSRRSRRGSTALEFALTLPLLLAFITATMDYGWFFLRESLVTNALQGAVRSGSYQEPAEDEAGNECSACVTRTTAVAVAELANLGITVTTEQVTPTIDAISSTCALVLQPDIPHTPLVGLVPTPTSYGIRIVAYAQNLSGC